LIQGGDEYGGNHCRFRGSRRHHHIFLRRFTGRRHRRAGEFPVVCLIFSGKKICQIK